MNLSLGSNPDKEGRGKAISESDELTTVVLRLNAVTKLMNGLAPGIYTCTCFNFVFTFLLPMFRPKVPEIVYLVTGVVIWLAAWFDRQRRKGDACFQEISDTQHWKRGSGDKITLSSSRDIPPTDKPSRTALADFTQASDLLLFTGKLGPGIYVAINFCLCAITTLAEK